MFLKYLEIQGFKSFPDRVKIEFVQGITAIVGPNGSGKSNISDAVRWVMGEQSIKTLRGGKMEDVIFAGTQDRKPVGFAEVSICFDNADHIFKLDYEEVLITRRLFRSGESEYYINKSACRLKDIHELLMDTGMGRDGYSVVGQGKIDEIITSKPEDRRIIFEEAAGISKYRYRKAEAERKMQQTQENLVRLLDLLSEIETRLGPLEQDAEKAKTFLKLRDELKEVEISLSLHQIDKLKEGIQKTTEEMTANDELLAQEQEKADWLQNQGTLLHQKAKDQEKAQQECTQALYECKNTISNLENKISLLTNSQAHNTETTQRLQREMEKIQAQIGSAKEEITAREKDREDLKIQREQQKQKLEAVQADYRSLGQNAEEAGKELEQVNETILDLVRQLSELKAELAGADTAAEGIRIQKEAFLEDLEFLQEDLEANQKRIDQGEAEKDRVNQEKNQAEQKLKQLLGQQQKLEEKRADNRDKQEKGAALLQQLVTQKNLLEEMERGMEGYSHSVKTVLSEAKNGHLKGIRAYGTVASVISLEDAYTTAAQAALGGALQNIITETEEDAKTAIAYLKEKKAGRATFLPISSVKGRKLDDKPFRGAPGVIGLACELVRCEDRFRGIVEELLGRTIVLDTMDHAISFSKKFKQQYKLVTLEGEIFNPGGAITGGNLNKSLGFLSRKAEIKKLKDRIDKAQQADRELKEEGEKLDAEIGALLETVKAAQSALHSLENECYKLDYNVAHYREARAGLVQQQEQLNKDMAQAEEKIKTYQARKEEAQRSQEEKKRQMQQLEEKADQLQQAGSAHTGELRNLNNDILRQTVEVSNLDNDYQTVSSRISSLKAQVEGWEAELAAKEEEYRTAGSADGEILQQVQLLQQQIQTSRDSQAGLEAQLSSIQEKRSELEHKEEDNKTAVRECNDQILLYSKEQARFENKKARQEGELDHIQTKLWEDYELTYLSAQPFRKEIKHYGDVTKQVGGLRRQIKDLGPVNVGAIDEYKETKERFDFLTGQKNDMDGAKETLKNVITDLESMMEKQFKDQLQVINQAFGRVFKDLFSGGTAELVLTDESDVLSSGVEIHAQPPGKKLQNMTLFSGGEKAIIAIALLFALLEVRPSPLCVLDEIEAALDDVNVSRFAGYLRRISERSQIAIITHRRGTMEEADILYGVTMQDKGVSRLLQLDINEMEHKILKQK